MNWTQLKALIAVILLPGASFAQQPLSAIDWLSNPVPVTSRIVPQAIDPAPGANEPPVTNSALTPDVEVKTLDQAGRDAVGLLPGAVTGLPANLWQASNSSDLVQALRHQDVLGLPAMQSLLYTLLLAEAEPPRDAGSGHLMLAARVGKLWDLGAIEAAQALIERAGPNTPDLFAQWFDLTLMSGDEEEACALLNTKPHLSRDSATRVFCMARGGDWNAAALLLDTARVLGLIAPTELKLLGLFLDPELIEGTGDLGPPDKMSPLVFRLYEAAGSPLPTAPLPRAYAMGDLRDTSGWKAELEAAERLSRTGALSENRLFEIYTARHPAASGGIWDRVEAVQRFDTAMQSGDPGAVARTLPGAWTAMQSVHLEVPFARFYGTGLARLPLAGQAHTLSFRIGLLSPQYEDMARKIAPQDDQETFLAALARGEPQKADSRDPLARSITRAFQDNSVPAPLAPLLEQGKLGEAILKAMSLFTSGVSGNFNDIENALRGFRAIGLEDTARRSALQLMLLNQGD